VKLKPVVDGAGQLRGYAFYCPGCDHAHVFWTAAPDDGRDGPWTFDSNTETPSFSPSLKNTAPDHVDPKQRCCHLNLVAGHIHYANDCTHDLVSTVVDLPDYPYGPPSERQPGGQQP
jgi:Family of unknown function (DUF6527)